MAGLGGQEPAMNKTAISETGSTWGGVRGCNYGIFVLTKKAPLTGEALINQADSMTLLMNISRLSSALGCQGVGFQGCGRLWLPLGYFGLLGPKKAVGKERGCFERGVSS